MDWSVLPGLRVTGSVTMTGVDPALDPEALARALAYRLEQAKAHDVTFGPTKVEFLGPPLFGTWGNWHVLLPVDSGELRIERSANSLRLRYRIGYTRLFLLALVMASVMGAWTGAGPQPPNAPGTVIIVVIVMSVLFGLNFRISIVRVRLFLQQTLRESVAEIRAARHAEGSDLVSN